MRKNFFSVLLLAAFSFCGVSCGESKENPLSVSVKQTLPITVEFVYLNPEGYPIILESGQVEILKNDKILLETSIQTIDEVTNSVQLAPLNQPPPYTYRLKNAKIKTILPERFMSLDGVVDLGNPVLLPSGAHSNDNTDLKNPLLLPSGAQPEVPVGLANPPGTIVNEDGVVVGFEPPPEEDKALEDTSSEAESPESGSELFFAGASFNLTGTIKDDLQKPGHYSQPEQEVTPEHLKK